MSIALAKDRRRMKAPPIPHEHGAWFMLYMPLLTVLVGMGAQWWQAVALIVAVTGGYLAQHVVVLMLRGRADAGDRLWLVVYGGLLVAGGFVLLKNASVELVWVGLPIVALMCWHLVRSQSARKRIDRSLIGELLAISGLTLTAPAAFVVVAGELTLSAIGIWILFVVFFYSSVFYVKMRIDAVQIKSGITSQARWVLGKGLLVYHVILGSGLVFVFFALPDVGPLLSIAFAPVFLRSFWGWIRLSNILPKLVVVGLIESGYTLWFSGWLMVVLQRFGGSVLGGF